MKLVGDLRAMSSLVYQVFVFLLESCPSLLYGFLGWLGFGKVVFRLNDIYSLLIVVAYIYSLLKTFDLFLY